VRVIFIPHAYAPSIGGAERYAQGLAEGLAQSGHEVHVVVADVTNPEAFYELGHDVVGMETESIRGVAVHRLPFLTFWYRNLGWLSQRQALSSAKKRFRDRLESSLADLRPDVVITLPHLFPNVGDVVGLRPSASW
jgi:glycosyltransferase involved in cell wall biosynthesis